METVIRVRGTVVPDSVIPARWPRILSVFLQYAFYKVHHGRRRGLVNSARSPDGLLRELVIRGPKDAQHIFNIWVGFPGFPTISFGYDFGSYLQCCAPMV